MAVPTLTLGAFNLSDVSGAAYGTSVMAQGTSRGSPVPIDVAVNSWLQDGSIVLAQGYDNRMVTVRVKLRAPTTTALATAEAALHLELRKPNLLTWVPASGPTSVFVVVNSHMDPVEDETSDLTESRAAYPWRHYDLRLTCEATVRSATETVTAALPATGTTTTLVNNGSATTNWTGAVSSGTLTGPTVVSGAVKVGTTAVVSGIVTVSSTYTASITTSSTKYIQTDWRPESPSGNPNLRVYADGVELTHMGSQSSPTAGFTRSWHGPVAASSIAVTRFDSTTDGSTADLPGAPAVRSLYIDNVNRTDVKPALGTARQLLRSIVVGGSARTPASVAVEHASSALGDVMLYVFPDSVNVTGYVPALRPNRVAGGATVTSDSALVSGARDAIGGATSTFDVPLQNLPPGLATLVVRVDTQSLSRTLTWTAATRVNSTQVGATKAGTSVVITSGYAIKPIARIDLPTVDVDPGATNAVVRITVTSSSVANLDEVWLFSDIGRLLGPVSCGTGSPASGGPANRLFVEPPTVTRPRQSVRIGFAADRSDSFHPGTTVGGWQFLEFKPTRANILSVTTNALDASVTMRDFDRWHTNPAS